MKTKQIINYATSLGYMCGICNAEPLEGERKRLLTTDTPFVTQNIEKRINPQLSLPNAKSIIVFGLSYKPSPYENLSSLGYGKDYHKTLKDTLNNLYDTIHAETGEKGVVMVDSGVLMERAFAVKSGLGFWGKNGMVISPYMGSFFNIGLLITTLELEPTPPCKDLGCYKDCTICINSCPNKAIKPYSVDAKKCISYITQSKIDYEPQLAGKQLYGCDICQNCCPFNNGFNGGSLTVSISPNYILQMGEGVFNAHFGETAMAWRGYKYLCRNAVKARG